MRAPTIRDVALRAGVSVATASNVVNGKRPVGQASRQRVEQAVAALEYRVNRMASALRASASRLIGMVVPDITNPFFAGLIQGVEEQAERSGYDLLLASSGEDPATERRRIEALIDRRIDGLLVVPATDISLQALREGARSALMPPMVVLDRGCDQPGIDAVAADGAAGAYAATRHLIELGHRDIAVLTHSTHLQNIAARIEGYRRALDEAGLRARAQVCAGGYGLDALRGAIEIELRRAGRPSAVFALTNIAALAAIKAARGLGLDIPGDISIAGFDDFDWMCALRPYLTTVAQPVDEFASTCWRLLMRRIANGAPAPFERIDLSCTLKVRESTGPARVRLKAVAGEPNAKPEWED